MFEALLINQETLASEQITAAAFLARREQGTLPAEFKLVSPYDGNPLFLRVGEKPREGGVKAPHRPHFALHRGYGDQAHVFENGTKAAFTEAVGVRNNAVLLNLNDDLSYRALDFRAVAPHTAEGGKSYEDWMCAHSGRYQTVPVHNVADVIKTIHRVKDILGAGSGWPSKIFTNYRGGVLPFSDFFISAKSYRQLPADQKPNSKLPSLFNKLGGAAGQRLDAGKARAVGLPHLVQFVPTKTTLEMMPNPQNISGMHIDRYDAEGHYCYGQLIFSDHADKRQTPAYQTLVEQIAQNPDNGIYVMASPCITPLPEGEVVHHKGQQIRWVINDIEAQTIPVGEVTNGAPVAGVT